MDRDEVEVWMICLSHPHLEVLCDHIELLKRLHLMGHLFGQEVGDPDHDQCVQQIQAAQACLQRGLAAIWC